MANIRRSEDAPLARRSGEWDPFRGMRELMAWDPFRETFAQLWGGSSGFAPAFDVRETTDRYVFQA
ncbi:MAG TPA: hypothetical protein VL137_04490, partial [Polyangiaceae bacterium]|nr:hypothetical protein [Polyangiaceae bacterium]